MCMRCYPLDYDVLKGCLLRRFDKRKMVLSKGLGRVDQNLVKRFNSLLLGWVGLLIDGLKCQVLLSIMRIYEI